MKNRQRFLVGAMLIAVFVVGGFYVYTYRLPMTAEHSALSDAEMTLLDTSQWKTYQNKVYGFEIKYPQEWSVGVGPGGYDMHFGTAAETTRRAFTAEGGDREPSTRSMGDIADNDLALPHNIQINLPAIGYDTTSDNALKRTVQLWGFKDVQQRMVEVDGISARMIVGTKQNYGPMGGPSASPVQAAGVFFIKDNQGYEILYLGSPYADDLNIFNNMVRTFKFIPATDAFRG